MPKNAFLTKKCAKFLSSSAQNPALEAYSGHSRARSAPMRYDEECPLQDKFLAVPVSSSYPMPRRISAADWLVDDIFASLTP